MNIKKLLCVVMALVLAALVFPTVLAEKLSPAEAPEGYDEYDYNKVLAFLETEDENGVKNGTKLDEAYDPADMSTWGKFSPEEWAWMDGKLWAVYIANTGVVGELDLSGCDELMILMCAGNGLTGINVSGCIALDTFECDRNALTYLDMTDCSELFDVMCDNNELTSITLDGCDGLQQLHCGQNLLTELDFSGAPSLTLLNAPDNLISEDATVDLESYFDTNGSDYVAKFTEGLTVTLLGDVDLDGEVTAADALLAMRHAMSITLASAQGIVNGDMDGDGALTANDAILIMRAVMGI